MFIQPFGRSNHSCIRIAEDLRCIFSISCYGLYLSKSKVTVRRGVADLLKLMEEMFLSAGVAGIEA